MRAWLVVPVVLWAAGTAHPNEVPDFLQPDRHPGNDYRDVAVPSRAAALFLTPGGAPAGKTSAGEMLVVVEAHGDRVRVVADSRVARVAAYVDPAALPLVAREAAVIVAREKDAVRRPEARDPGVRLRAGTPLEATGRPHNGVLAVRYTAKGGAVIATGFVAENRVGRTFIDEKQRGPGNLDALLAPTEVLAAPRGARLATLRGKRAFSAERLGDEERGHVLVRVDARPAEIVGWVAARALRRPPETFSEEISAGRIGIPGKRAHRPPVHGVELTRGTLLSIAPDGPPAGVVLVTARFATRGKPRGAWQAFAITGPYRDVVLYARVGP